jgi:hypothetical protein
MSHGVGEFEHLAAYRRCNERVCANWRAFQELRQQRLAEQLRFGHAAEGATERVLEDLLTTVLDWSAGEINHQVGYADILLTRLGIKHLIIEAKRPGALAWNRHAVDQALEQARRYAAEQKVASIAISDSHMLYACDVAHGGIRDRLYCSLPDPYPPDSLWWLSIDGIYRQRAETAEASLRLLPDVAYAEGEPSTNAEHDGQLLHHKYRLPVGCFAYVGDASDTRTWHLPYLNADGSVDTKRLPGAIGAILRNYRGAHVKSIPESAIPDVLARLAHAADRAGKMPSQTGRPADAYVQLGATMEQLGISPRGARGTP